MLSFGLFPPLCIEPLLRTDEVLERAPLHGSRSQTTSLVSHATHLE
jgi:hypothetical protein